MLRGRFSKEDVVVDKIQIKDIKAGAYFTCGILDSGKCDILIVDKTTFKSEFLAVNASMFIKVGGAGDTAESIAEWLSEFQYKKANAKIELKD